MPGQSVLTPARAVCAIETVRAGADTLWPGVGRRRESAVAAEDDRVTDGTGQVCLGLLPFGPDPVRSPPLHRTRPSTAATGRPQPS